MSSSDEILTSLSRNSVGLNSHGYDSEFVLPIMGMFCRTPFEPNWNKSVKPKCFMTPNEIITYTQVCRKLLSNWFCLTHTVLGCLELRH